MDYEIILITADRPAILEVSIPTFAQQTRPARRLIVVDASRDHQAAIDAVQQASVGAPFEVQIMQGPRGMTRQRNFGIPHVESGVIFFPDDDSLWYPDVAERVMRVYEQDQAGVIGGVGQAAASAPTHALSDQDEAARSAGRLDRTKYQLAKARFALLNKLVVNPLHACGEELMKHFSPPDWLASVDAEHAPFQIGFRMSYRTEAVRRYPFNEDLHQPRCGQEDFDASFGVQRHQMLVEARGALVYHHKIGGWRGAALETGLTPFLNLCYIVSRHSPPGSRARRAIKPYCRFFLLEQLLFRCGSRFGRGKARGMLRAMKALDWLVESPPQELTARYQEAFERCLAGKPVPPTGD